MNISILICNHQNFSRFQKMYFQLQISESFSLRRNVKMILMRLAEVAVLRQFNMKGKNDRNIFPNRLEKLIHGELSSCVNFMLLYFPRNGKVQTFSHWLISHLTLSIVTLVDYIVVSFLLFRCVSFMLIC